MGDFLAEADTCLYRHRDSFSHVSCPSERSSDGRNSTALANYQVLCSHVTRTKSGQKAAENLNLESV